MAKLGIRVKSTRQPFYTTGRFNRTFRRAEFWKSHSSCQDEICPLQAWLSTATWRNVLVHVVRYLDIG